MTVTFSLTLSAPQGIYAGLYSDLSEAAADWSRYLNSNASIRVEVDVGSFPNNTGFVIQNDSTDIVAVGTTTLGQTLVEPWGEYALLTDSHVAGSPYDIHLYLSTDNLYINPDPAAGGPVPAGDYDATTMFRKALGYGLGFMAMSTTNASPVTEVTALDRYVQPSTSGFVGSSLGVDLINVYSLVGPAAEAVYGGPVPLVTPPSSYHEATVHIGNTPTIGGASDIMAVTQDIVGLSLPISTLDLAIMQDAGVPVITGTIPCFAAGTRIMTPRGLVAVERLRTGDTVLTLAGAAQRIKWIGHRRVDCRRHRNPDEVMPARVLPHAFGHGRPGHKVLLSPDHAVFVEDVLIPIRYLVNDGTVARITAGVVTYYHLELSRHDVIFADGLPVESYLRVGDRSAFNHGGTVIQLHPEFGPDARQIAIVWESLGFAPLLVSGVPVQRARAKLRLQAALLAASRGAKQRRIAAAA